MVDSNGSSDAHVDETENEEESVENGAQNMDDETISSLSVFSSEGSAVQEHSAEKKTRKALKNVARTVNVTEIILSISENDDVLRATLLDKFKIKNDGTQYIFQPMSPEEELAPEVMQSDVITNLNDDVHQQQNALNNVSYWDSDEINILASLDNPSPRTPVPQL